MTLDEYLTIEGMTETTFAAAIGVSQPQVNRLRKNKSWPGRELLARIFEATGGRVTPSDFVPGTTPAAHGEAAEAA